MHRVIIAIGLQLLAVSLALLRLQGGILTDEAKYLLNIPYPHPPLARSVLHWLTVLPAHEVCIRILFATLMIQAVWLLSHITRDLPSRLRLCICALWLGSAAVIVQAGTIMMSPLTAMFGFVLMLVAVGKEKTSIGSEERRDWRIFCVAFLWLASLFTAYQAVLHFPLLIAALRRLGAKKHAIAICVLGPIVPLLAYSLANPLSLGSMLIVVGSGPGTTVGMRFADAAWLWWVAGSGVLSVLGIWGAILRRRFDILGTFALVFTYVLLSPQGYYSILFTPVLLGGVIAWLRDPHSVWHRKMCASIATTFVVWLFGMFTIFHSQVFWPVTNPARDTIATLEIEPGVDLSRLVIVGFFGHQWQYYAQGEVMRYTPAFAGTGASVVICTAPCPLSLTAGARQIPLGTSVDVYMR